MNSKLFLIASLATLPAFTAGAQTALSDNTDKKQATGKPYGLSIGLNAGTCINTRAYNDNASGNATGRPGATVGIGLYYRFNRHWEIGFTADYKVMNSLVERNWYDEQSAQPVVQKRREYYPAITTAALVNYHFPVRKLDLYAGLSAGFTVLYSNYDRNGWGIDYPQTHDTRFSTGVHLGMNYPLGRHWGFNTQLGVERLSSTDRSGLRYMVVPTATVGIRFRF